MTSVERTAEQATARRIVKALGGPTRARALIVERLPAGTTISKQGVMQWYKGGVSHRFRGLVQQLCEEHHIELPPGFSTMGAE